MYTYKFEKLEIWQISRKLVKNIYQTTDSFPNNEKFGLTNQLRRATISVSSNIAEGAGRNSNKEKARFFEIAYSSLLEIINQLIISNNLGFIDNDTLNNYRLKINELSNKINSYHKKLLKQ